MVTPEGKTKKAIRKVIEKVAKEFDIDIWTFWPVPYGYGRSTVDALGCINGCFFAIEAKADGNEPTTRQGIELSNIEASGGKIFVIDDEDDPRLMDLLDWLLSRLPPHGCPPS